MVPQKSLDYKAQERIGMLLFTVSPEQFTVKYHINPFMKSVLQKHEGVNLYKAIHQYQGFLHLLRRFATVNVVPVAALDPAAALPDIIYAADAAVFLPGLKEPTAIMARHSRSHRRPEGHAWTTYFNSLPIRQLHLPLGPGIYFEGSGEAVFTLDFTRIFCGYGIRTSKKGALALNVILEEEYRRQNAVDKKPMFHMIKLVNQKYFHVDLCLRPLPHGYALIRRNAISKHSQELIEAIFGSDKLIEVDDDEPFACNGILADGHYLTSSGISEKTIRAIEATGTKVLTTVLTEFEKGGGSLKCMILPLH